MKHENAANNVIQFNSVLEGKNIPLKRRLSENTGPRVVSIASGKGGVGKTNIVANLGYALRRMDKKVLILDADLGLGNLDILLGLSPKYNLSHFILGEREMEEIIVEGPSGMKIIPAASGIRELAHLSKEQKIPVLQKLDELINQYDVFLIDTAAGISNNVLHFAAIAQDVLVVVSPEPTSLTDAYALIKVLSYHYDIKDFNLVVNMVKSAREAEEIHRQLQMVTNRFLDVRVQYIGHVLADEKIPKGVKRQKIVSEIYPDSPAVKCFAPIAESILDFRHEKKSGEKSNFIWENILNY